MHRTPGELAAIRRRVSDCPELDFVVICDEVGNLRLQSRPLDPVEITLAKDYLKQARHDALLLLEIADSLYR